LAPLWNPRFTPGDYLTKICHLLKDNFWRHRKLQTGVRIEMTIRVYGKIDGIKRTMNVV